MDETSAIIKQEYMEMGYDELDEQDPEIRKSLRNWLHLNHRVESRDSMRIWPETCEITGFEITESRAFESEEDVESAAAEIISDIREKRKDWLPMPFLDLRTSVKFAARPAASDGIHVGISNPLQAGFTQKLLCIKIHASGIGAKGENQLSFQVD